MLRTRSVAIAAAAVFVVFAVWLVAGGAAPGPLQAVDDIVLVTVSLVAVLFAVLAARSTRGRPRYGWTVFAVALLSWSAGEAVWVYHELVLKKPGFPSPADGFFLMFPVGAAAALLLLWNRWSRRSWGRIVLDGWIVSGSLLVMSWLLVLRKLYETGTSSTLEFAVLLSYPALDVIALTIAAAALVSATAAQRLPLTLLTLGMASMWLADSVYAYLQLRNEYVNGDVVDLAWLAGLLLFAVAAAAGRNAPDVEPALDEVPGWASVWLPYLPLMGAVAVLASSPVTITQSPLIMSLGALITVAVLLRQYLVVDLNRRLLATVSDQALRDPLTGLANRALFSDRLDRALRSPSPDAAPVGVIVIDLDDFKLINDTLGHQAGDDLLTGTGERIRGAVRADDTVARLGGDEFAILIEAPAAQLEALARRVVDSFKEPLTVGRHALVMRPSVGLAVAGRNDPTVSAQELVHRADVAMYSAKRSRDCSLKIYTDDLGDDGPDAAAPGPPDRPAQAGGVETMRQLGELRTALQDRKLALVYQPKVDLYTGSVVGLEALLRWPHPDRGLLGPDQFLPLVRRYDLIDEVTEFVLDRALDDAQAWRSAGLEVPVAVNLFPPSLTAPELPHRIDAALGKRGLAASALTVEITEDLVLGDMSSARQVLMDLRERGISVAIDDFGSGYSALWYLRDLPVDTIKLDRHFVAPIVADPRGAAVVRAVIDLARVLGIATVAEGVEDAATADMLRQYGCEMAQGYYFSQPLSMAEVLGTFAPAPVTGPESTAPASTRSN